MKKLTCLLVLVVAALFAVGCDDGSVSGDDGSQTDVGKSDTASVDPKHPPCEVWVQRDGTVSPEDPCQVANLGRCTSDELAKHPSPGVPTSYKGTCESGCLIQTTATASTLAQDVIVPLGDSCSGINPGVRGTCMEVLVSPRTNTSATVYSCVGP